MSYNNLVLLVYFSFLIFTGELLVVPIILRVSLLYHVNNWNQLLALFFSRRLCDGGELLDRILSKWVNLLYLYLTNKPQDLHIWVTKCFSSDIFHFWWMLFVPDIFPFLMDACTCYLSIAEVVDILKRRQNLSLYKF